MFRRFGLFIVLLASTTFLSGGFFDPKIQGKVSAGPAYFNISVQEAGKTRNKLDMVGGRFDATVLFFKNNGLCLIPTFLFGKGGGSLTSGGLAVGHYTPVGKCLVFTPCFGWGFSSLSSTIDFLVPGTDIVIPRIKERFRSNYPYLGLNVAYTFNDQWVLTGYYNYAWASCKTTLQSIGHFKGHSSGPSWGAAVDYYFSDCWSVFIAGGANSSMDKERFGIEGLGAMIGLGYIFKTQ